ncbi:DUF1294 domain-containing protein [Streptococcus porcinus]|uniref:DUF1294 domain-containing protein n=1 Tax=Streptococcus porcinus TaxID=1340 RepID=A0A7V9WS21_STRPO|nr:DUF1294 domain-containing protein [Streptococcus porcinus]MBA2796046.1 DUF1294 domain-containing protein [Streptococcus porcinus]
MNNLRVILALLSVLLLWNLIVFAVYGIDKGRAMKGRWRISESTLIGMTLFFGGLGAWLAAKIFHHKTQKWYFQVIWGIGIAILVILGYFIYFYSCLN